MKMLEKIKRWLPVTRSTLERVRREKEEEIERLDQMRAGMVKRHELELAEAVEAAAGLVSKLASIDVHRIDELGKYAVQVYFPVRLKPFSWQALSDGEARWHARILGQQVEGMALKPLLAQTVAHDVEAEKRRFEDFGTVVDEALGSDSAPVKGNSSGCGISSRRTAAGSG